MQRHIEAFMKCLKFRCNGIKFNVSMETEMLKDDRFIGKRLPSNI